LGVLVLSHIVSPSYENNYNALYATHGGQAIANLAQGRRVDLGKGFFPSGDIAIAQDEAQRELIGELEFGGEMVAYTPGRAMNKFAEENNLYSHDSMIGRLASGTVDGTIKAIGDVGNFLPGIGWGRIATKGLPTGRNIGQWNQLSGAAREALEAGNEAGATELMLQALASQGITPKSLDRKSIQSAFQGVNETDLAIRASLLDEAGIVRQGDTVSVMMPEFARFLTQGNGRRLIEYTTGEKSAYRLWQMHEGGIGYDLAQRLAQASDPAEVVRLYAYGMANPGEHLENMVRAFPHIGVFNIADKRLTVMRAIHSRTRMGQYLPVASVLSPTDGNAFLQQAEALLKSLPLGAGTSGTRYDIELVEEFMNKAIKAFSEGNRGKIVELAGEVEKSIGDMFYRMGYTLEEAQDLAQWTANIDRLGRYAQKDLAAGIPVSMEESGPLLYSQLLNQGIILIDQSRLTEVLRRTGRIRENLRHATPYAKMQAERFELVEQLQEAKQAKNAGEISRISRDLSKLESEIDKVRQGDDALFWINVTSNALESARYYWKSSTIARLAYITRVVPEELARILLGGVFEGPVDYLSAMSFGGYQSDALGQAFTRTTHALDEANLQLGEELLARRELMSAGLEAEAKALDTKIAQLDAKVEKLQNDFDASKDAFHQSLIGRSRSKRSETMMREQSRVLSGTGQRIQVTKANPQQADQWTEGLIQQLYGKHLDEPMRVLARAVLGRPITGVVEIDGVKATITQHIKKGRIETAEEGLAWWLFAGRGRKIWEDYATSISVTNRPLDVNSFDDAMSWVMNMADEMAYLVGGTRSPTGVRLRRAFGDDAMEAYEQATGMALRPNIPTSIIDGDISLIEVIATGRFHGTPLRMRTRQLVGPGSEARGWTYKTNNDAREHVAKFRESDRAPSDLLYETGLWHGEEKTTLYQEIINGFFGGLYGVTSDVLARSPAWRRIYWQQMAKLVRAADKEAADKIVRNARAANLPKRLMEELESNAKARAGNASASELDELSKFAAIEETKNLLYDSTKRGATADALRWVVAFGDAWKEVYSTWAKLLVRQQGKPAVRVAQGFYYGEKNGIFYREPTTGEFMYAIPGSQRITEALIKARTGVEYPNAPRVTGRARGLNVAGGLFPGFMPIMDRIVNAALPDSPRFNSVRDFFFFYGEPPTPESFAAQREGIETLLVPVWLRRFSAIFRGAASLDYLGNLLSQAETDIVWQNQANNAYKALVSTGRYGNNQEDQEQLRKDVQRVSDTLYFIRGVAHFIGPAAPTFEFFANTKDGNVVAPLLINEYNETLREYLDAGMPGDLALYDLLDKYGPDVFLYSQPNTRSTLRGADASREWFDWYRENRELVDRYKLIGAYFGPTGDFDLSVRQAFMARGIYEIMPRDELYNEAARSLMLMAYNRYREALGSEETWAFQQRLDLSSYRNQLENQFGIPLFSDKDINNRKQQITQALRLVENAKAGESTALEYAQTPTGQALVKYMAARDVSIRQATSLGLTEDGWKTAIRASGIRDGLQAIGEQLAAEDSGFSRLYQFVLQYEMADQVETTVPQEPVRLSR
jgi:hypothetical protein